MDYRVYLIDEKPSIRAADHYTADDDNEAIEVASFLHDACSDVFPSCEVWRGPTLLAKLRVVPGEHMDGNVSDLSSHISSNVRLLLSVRQENIIRLEDRLQRSFASVRESQQLLRTLSQLTDGR